MDTKRIQWRRFGVVAVVMSMAIAGHAAADEQADLVAPIVEVEEVVYEFESANNGAGPMWCFGNSCIVRSGEQVFASGLHTLGDAEPLNNCVPSLWRRTDAGWETVYRSTERTREPSPLGLFPESSVLLSVNPTRAAPDAYSGPAEPGVLEFSIEAPRAEPRLLAPDWDGAPPFSEHSYRSLAVDGHRRELILFQNIGYTHAEWSFRNESGDWSASGKLAWPRDNDSDGAPIRVCYPTVALDRRRVYFCGVSDIVEPNPVWQEHKRQLTGREWDYVFRRLYFTWSDDITTGQFHDWVEIANYESTAGAVFPNDLYVAADGSVALLWTATRLDERLREQFFPAERQRHGLEFARVENGQVRHYRPLVEWRDESPEQRPGRGRFHVTPDGQLWVVCSIDSADQEGGAVRHNQVLKIGPTGDVQAVREITLEQPMASFFTNTPRAGCVPAQRLDMFGQVGNSMRYARIRFP